MSSVLYIAAKAPRPGLAKTRLGRAIGDQQAAQLYRAFLQDIGARFAGAPFEVAWFITPPDAWREIAPLVVGARREPRVMIQGEGDWTARQRQLFQTAARRGEERVIIIASDSPHITVDLIAAAFRELDRHDLVIGPVFDGGYYLLGMRGWHDVLAGISMSTASVVQEIISQAHAMSLSIAQVETTFDIDEGGDIHHLLQVARQRDDLPATRAALESLNLAG